MTDKLKQAEELITIIRNKQLHVGHHSAKHENRVADKYCDDADHFSNKLLELISQLIEENERLKEELNNSVSLDIVAKFLGEKSIKVNDWMNKMREKSLDELTQLGQEMGEYE